MDFNNDSGLLANIASISTIGGTVTFDATGGVALPSGSTAQRPNSPAAGMTRFNTTAGVGECWNGSRWVASTPVVVQMWSVEIGQSSFANSIIPWDSTTPRSTEGTEYATITITTTTATSKIYGRFNAFFDTSTSNRNIIMAAFRGTTCIDSSVANAGTAGRPVSSSISFIDTPGSIGTFIYKINIGVNASTTIYVNRSSTVTMGGSSTSQFVVQEVIV